jgi:hypothetical protein
MRDLVLTATVPAFSVVGVKGGSMMAKLAGRWASGPRCAGLGLLMLLMVPSGQSFPQMNETDAAAD